MSQNELKTLEFSALTYKIPFFVFFDYLHSCWWINILFDHHFTNLALHSKAVAQMNPKSLFCPFATFLIALSINEPQHRI
jgi:hypothetical protein